MTMRQLFAAAVMLAASALPAAAQDAPSAAVLQDLAPTGKLRAGINFGNPVLTQKGPNGEPRGVSAELAAALAKRLGVPLEYVPFQAAGKSRHHRRHLYGAPGFAAQGCRRRRQPRHQDRRRARARRRRRRASGR
jgi:hypothetical protein